ncbi:activator of osmoprotectant transporter ProP [Idiomarina sp. A28L]|uniref:RNA chaperone ProQ n=1 Tax=Idiomarina sp. A28L TaxID=1036674 RepID=UPI0002138916|nr:RNA chaperone ProQ [Idiomarina sp. A28L]EGN75787.1 activator of osmoprotectant transporter ProP [Idiomarina sp. A28L]
MENTAKLSTSKEVIAYLATQFPTCFTLEGEARPLKIGIFDDLAIRLADDEHVSKTRLRSALRQYTGSWRYLRGVKAGVERVDLDGNDAGLVEADHEEHAQLQLAESQERAKAKRAERAAESKAAATKARAAKNKDAQDGVRKDKDGKSKVGTKPKSRRTNPLGSSATEKKATPKANGPLEVIKPDQVKIGQAVQIKVGSFPVTGTITEIDKNAAQVQLPTGMSVRVLIADLFRV